MSFDYLWWVLAAYFLMLLVNRREPRWWVAIGAVVGLGMLTKYTVLFLMAGIAGGLLLTEERRYLLSRWLWIGAAAALVIFLPNAVWAGRARVHLARFSALHPHARRPHRPHRLAS